MYLCHIHYNLYPIFIEEEEPPPKEEVKVVPLYGTREWIQHRSEFEGHLPSPIDVSITDSLAYPCPELKWYNFDVYPHKVKITNTGYTGISITTRASSQRSVYAISGVLYAPVA